MPFYPPDQLPPMKRRPVVPSRRLKAVFVVGGTLLGTVSAVLLVWQFGSALAWLAIPCAAGMGWGLASLPCHFPGRGGRVLW
ncbi:hypothetical protein [Roseateles asaccharophilus]|uniref:PrgI family protein n=1 Tax=Roseateles asaccharophilus TaxID=582607 RepID=A0ABU2AFR7_9BURK|nr:hypothetical protein [Roseateles asaccharophilus]MDR7335825.1 hypothetical protein [Roseateles asaccharophilus]